MVLFCEVCNVNVSSVFLMTQHVSGKKHKRSQVIFDFRRRRTEQTVYVRGFPADTTKEELKAYFSRFGNIDDIVLDEEKHYYAFIEFDNVSAVKAVLAQRRHHIRGHKMTARPRELKPSRRLPHLTGKQANQPKPGKLEEHGTPSVDRQQMITEQLNKCHSVSEQMRCLVAEVSLSTEDHSSRIMICRSLQNVLRQYFPACTLHAFGSSVNGFGVRGCDLDVFLDLHEESEVPAPQLMNVRWPFIKDIKSLRKKTGHISAADIHQMALYDKIKLLSRILCDRMSGCNELMTIPSPRCPVVRFVHQMTGLKCDLSINNRLALQNSNLLNQFNSLDTRVRLLVHAIRHWGKEKQVATNPNSGPRLTNYALTMLVVFYLQNTRPLVLPAVEALADLCGDNRTVIDGWDCSFIADTSMIPPSENTMTPEQLLEGFFSFYSAFNFDTSVICPKTGKTALLSEILHLDSCPADAKDFRIGPINIQDPFVLNHNVAGNVNEKVRCILVEELHVASYKSQQWQSSPDQHGGLLDVFSDRIPEEFRGSTLVPEIVAQDKNSFPLTLKSSMLSEQLLISLQETKHYKGAWCQRVCKFVHKILEEVLLFKCEVVSDCTSDLISHDSKSVMSSPLEDNSVLSTCRLFSPGELSNHASIDDIDSKEVFSLTYKAAEQCVLKSDYVGGSTKLSDVKTEPIPSNSDFSETIKHDSVSGSDANDSVPNISVGQSSKFVMTSSTNQTSDSVPNISVDQSSKFVMTSSTNQTSDSVPNISVDQSSKSVVTPAGGQCSNKRLSSNTKIHDSIVKRTKLSNEICNSSKDIKCNKVYLRLNCKVTCSTWMNRKQFKMTVLNEGYSEGVALEKRISELLIEQDGSQSHTVLGFSCDLHCYTSISATNAVIKLQQTEGGKEFQAFYSFFKALCIKLVDRHLE